MITETLFWQWSAKNMPKEAPKSESKIPDRAYWFLIQHVKSKTKLLEPCFYQNGILKRLNGDRIAINLNDFMWCYLPDIIMTPFNRAFHDTIHIDSQKISEDEKIFLLSQHICQSFPSDDLELIKDKVDKMIVEIEKPKDKLFGEHPQIKNLHLWKKLQKAIYNIKDSYE